MNKILMMLKHNTMMVIYIAGAFAIIATIIALIWIYRVLCCDKNSQNNSTATREVGMPQGLIEFSVEELRGATNNFDKCNRMGLGCFGQVYIGMTKDMLMAIKKLSGFPHPEFLAEVSYISKIQHSNVVNLVGYCCQDGHQMLVYEYLVNGSLRDHLRGMRDHLRDYVYLPFKKRISIALGAAKGLQHMHNLTPPLQHKRFTTAKVLLDGDFNAKVSDAGLSRLLQERDIRLHNPKGGVEETVDVYSFGLFLLELITGEKPQELKSNYAIRQWIRPRICSNTLFDEKRTGTFMRESFKRFMKITCKCLKYPATNRLKMDVIVTELEKIYQNENRRVALRSDPFTIRSRTIA